MVQRAVLAIEEDFVLALEVVIQVCRREIGGCRDVAHARVGEAALAEQACGSPENGVPLPATTTAAGDSRLRL